MENENPNPSQPPIMTEAYREIAGVTNQNPPASEGQSPTIPPAGNEAATAQPVAGAPATEQLSSTQVDMAGSAPTATASAEQVVQHPSPLEQKLQELRDANSISPETDGVLQLLAEDSLVGDPNRLQELSQLAMADLMMEPEFLELQTKNAQKLDAVFASMNEKQLAELFDQKDLLEEVLPFDTVEAAQANNASVDRVEKALIQQESSRNGGNKQKAESRVRRLITMMALATGQSLAEGIANSSFSDFLDAFFKTMDAGGRSWQRYREYLGKGESAEMITLGQINEHLSYKKNLVDVLNLTYEKLKHTEGGSIDKPSSLKEKSEYEQMSTEDLKAVFSELQTQMERDEERIKQAFEAGLAESMLHRESGNIVVDGRIYRLLKDYATDDRKLNLFVTGFKDQK